MSEENDQQPTGKSILLSEIWHQHLNGPQGDSLFHMPISDILADTRDVLELLDRMPRHGDDRSKVLLAAMVCESAIDMLLRQIMPAYEGSLEKDSAVTFSLKTKLLAALNLVPHHLIEAANIVRGVRNQFAHDLKVDKLDDLDDKLKSKMVTYYVSRGIHPEGGHHDVVHLFDSVAYGATAGIAAYRTAVRDLNLAIRDPAMEAALRKRSEERRKVAIKILLEHANTAPQNPEPNPTLF